MDEQSIINMLSGISVVLIAINFYYVSRHIKQLREWQKRIIEDLAATQADITDLRARMLK